MGEGDTIFRELLFWVHMKIGKEVRKDILSTMGKMDQGSYNLLVFYSVLSTRKTLLERQEKNIFCRCLPG